MDLSKKKASNSKDEDQFYLELDEKRSHNSCCTCQTLLILFIAILIISTAGLFYLYYKSTRGDFFPINIGKKTDIETKISDIKADSQNNFELILSSDDLSDLLNSVPFSGNYVLKNIRASISSSNVLIYGNLIKPISAKVTIIAFVTAENGEVKFNIEEITLGELKLFNFVAETFSDNLSSLFNNAMRPLYEGYTIEKVELKDNQMIISGKKKE